MGDRAGSRPPPGRARLPGRQRGGAPRSFDPRDVRIETADGTYWPRIVVGTEPEFHPITLAPFADASGWIIFRVSADARPVAVVWTAAPGLVLRIPLPQAEKVAD